MLPEEQSEKKEKEEGTEKVSFEPYSPARLSCHN